MQPQTIAGYTFRDPALLLCALTHSSYAHENGLNPAACNERLEFLGDAVLELTASEYLYRRHSSLSEGELTKCRAGLVCEASLAELARSIGLGNHLRFGRGEEQSGGRDRDSLLADALEAVFGAIYLDGGLEQAQAIILSLLEPAAAKRPTPLEDHKTTLQEILQRDSRESAVYAIINETGPAHRKEFTATVSHLGRVLGTGIGKNKKEAEQNAAKAALVAQRKG